jgi:CPA2 family monovalent cation:H+ antiporter-2/glutathione-regulated potassium-efflux system protein KefB
MGRAALEQMGDSREDIDRAEAFYRANDRERLDMQKEHGDIRAGRDRTITERHTWAEAGSEL